MHATVRLFALALLAPFACAQSSGAPSYSAAGLVNAATNQGGALAPNTWATLYGSNLSWNTSTAGPGNLVGNQLPVQIPGAGVQVLLSGGTPAHLLFVSPTQINFLVPASRSPGAMSLTVVRDGFAGPSIPLTVADVAPGIFQNNSLAVATHLDGSVVNENAPAVPGEIIVLYCTGLGQTAVPLDTQSDGRLVPLDAPPSTIRIQRFAELAITLAGNGIDPKLILWAGLTPGFAGLYQVNLQLPDALDTDPEIRIWIGTQASPPGVQLAARP